MPDRSELEALLGRVENATGPDRKLDFAIWNHFYPPDPARVHRGPPQPANFGKGALNEAMDPRPNLSASVDAALALVERLAPDWAWHVSKIEGIPTRAPLRDCEARLWLPGRRTKGLPVETVNADGATVPLAILAALLKALIAQSHPAEPLKVMPA